MSTLEIVLAILCGIVFVVIKQRLSRPRLSDNDKALIKQYEEIAAKNPQILEAKKRYEEALNKLKSDS